VLPGPALPRATGVCGQSRGTPSTTIPTRGPKVGGYAKVASYFVTDKFKQSGLGPVADGMSKAWHTLVGCCGGWSQTFGKRPLGWTLVVMERKKNSLNQRIMQLFGHSKTKYEMKITKESQIVRFCETLCLLFIWILPYRRRFRS